MDYNKNTFLIILLSFAVLVSGSIGYIAGKSQKHDKVPNNVNVDEISIPSNHFYVNSSGVFIDGEYLSGKEISAFELELDFGQSKPSQVLLGDMFRDYQTITWDIDLGRFAAFSMPSTKDNLLVGGEDVQLVVFDGTTLDNNAMLSENSVIYIRGEGPVYLK